MKSSPELTPEYPMVSILTLGLGERFVINESGYISPALNSNIIFLLFEDGLNMFSAAVILSARVPFAKFGCTVDRFPINLLNAVSMGCITFVPFTQPILSPILKFAISSAAEFFEYVKPLRTLGEVKLVVPSNTNAIS